MNTENIKIVIFVPETHADAVREAMGKAGAGKIGDYSFCSFSSKGVGRFKPEQGSRPYIGKEGTFEEVAEERIETICSREQLNEVITAIKEAHPYDEVAVDMYPLLDL